ncbi:MAG: elongation factor G, partial [Pseudomonadota bacterium]
REAYAAAAPRLLEPLGRIEAQAPEAHVGAVIADLQARRGAVLGVEPGARLHRVCAEAPMANLWGYAGAVRSLTRGHGQASVGFARHAPAPQAVAETLTRQA